MFLHPIAFTPNDLTHLIYVPIPVLCALIHAGAHTGHLFGLDRTPPTDPVCEQPSAESRPGLAPTDVDHCGSLAKQKTLIAGLISFQNVKHRINPNLPLWNYKIGR